MKLHKDRVECIYCKELILIGATKCRYCGEKQQNKVGNINGLFAFFAKKSLSLWILSILIFFLLLYLADFDFSNEKNGFLLILLVLDVAMGGLAFLFYFIPSYRMFYKGGTEESGFLRMLTSIGICVLFFYLLSNLSNIEGYFGKNTKHIPVLEKTSVTIPTPQVTTIPTINLVKNTTVQKKVATHDGTRTGNIVDYYSYCEKKNIKVYENELIPYTTKAGKQIYSTKSDIQCYENEYNSYGGSQNSQPVVTTNTQNNSNKTPVFLSYGSYTVYCPSQNVGAVMSINSTMESKKSEWAKNYNDCVDTYFKSNSCILACKQTSTTDSGICTSAYGYSGSNYDACYKEVWDNYSSCISKCSPNSAESCQYVYAEQKSLTSQINNLCK